MASKKITVQLTGSLIGQTKRAAANVKGLGLRKVGSRKELVDTDSIRGMINRVSHLVKIVE